MKKVILIGMPRTGSSLLRKLLLSTGQVVMPAEAPGGTFPATAKAFWAAWHSSPENLYSDHQWQGYCAYNEDIQNIEPKNSVNNTPVYDMPTIKRLYWPILQHLFNPSNILGSDQWFGVKDVLNACSSVWISRFLRAMHDGVDGEQYRTVFMVRHPYDQILSHINAPWNQYPDNPSFIRGVFREQMQDWVVSMSFMHKAFVEEKEAGSGVVFYYEDRNTAAMDVFHALGLEWTEKQEEMMGYRFNSSVITHKLDADLALRAHSEFINHGFIKQFPPKNINLPPILTTV